MSRKKGANEKLFQPLYVDGQTVDDFKRRIWENTLVAVEGVAAGEAYKKALKVRGALSAIYCIKEILPQPRDQKTKSAYEGLIARARRQILDYFENAFSTHNGLSLRLLADIIENIEARSSDAYSLIQFCETKPLDYVFNFKELLRVVAKAHSINPPYDEAVEQRTRRLIRAFAIRIQKGQ